MNDGYYSAAKVCIGSAAEDLSELQRSIEGLATARLGVRVGHRRLALELAVQRARWDLMRCWDEFDAEWRRDDVHSGDIPPASTRQ